MLARRLRRRPSIKTTLDQSLVLAADSTFTGRPTRTLIGSLQAVDYSFYPKKSKSRRDVT